MGFPGPRRSICLGCDGLIATDHQQRILLTNAAARELMAFRVEDWKKRQLWEVVPLEDVLKAVTEVSLTGEQKTVSVGPVSGRYLDVTVTRLPLRPAGFIIVAHDVTETMRYEELRKEFVANVSHELRTPLSVIKGYVETLQDGALDDRSRAAQYLATVQRHTENLSTLVDELLSLSRLDSTSAVHCGAADLDFAYGRFYAARRAAAVALDAAGFYCPALESRYIRALP